MSKQKRFRGIHSYYDSKTKTHHVYTYDPKTKAFLAELLIQEGKITIIKGALKNDKP